LARAASLAILLLPFLAATGFGREARMPPEQHGRALAEQMCAPCHAIGRSGGSPHVGAPTFRQLDRAVDLDAFAARLRAGLMVGHPDMPMFRFKHEDARDFVLYLRSIQAP
jgi:cytochrome c